MKLAINWTPGISLEAIEKEAILQAFRFYRSNKTMTASALGISVRTLDAKLEIYLAGDKKQKEAEDLERAKRAEWLERARGVRPPISFPTKEKGTEDGNSAQAGVRVESVETAPAQHAVPVPKRQEVQSVSPRSNASSSSGKSR